MIRPLSAVELHGLILDTVAPLAPAIPSRSVVDNSAAVARILGMVDLAPLTHGRRYEAPVPMTLAALKVFVAEFGEYSHSIPTYLRVGTRWALNENAYPRRGPPRWWIVQAYACSPPDPSHVMLSRRPVKLLGDLDMLLHWILVQRYRRNVLRFRSRSAAWFAREAS